MDVKSRFAWLFVALLVGCSDPAGPSVLSRLEEESPVVHDKLIVSGCKIDGNDCDKSSPVRAKRNASLELTGLLAPKEWSTGGIFNGWKDATATGPQSIRTLNPKARQISLALLVHGNDVSERFGVVEALIIEARPLEKTPSEFEFRAKFKAPGSSGKYVADLQVGDMTEGSRKRGDVLTKPAGFPIWRCELWVE